MAEPKQEPDFALTPAELKSPAWKSIKKYLAAQREAVRTQLESDMDEVKTAKLRGDLRRIRNLLALDQPDRDPADPEADAEEGE